MTIGEGIALGLGGVALMGGMYFLVQSSKEDSQTQAARLQAQLQAQLAQRPQPANTGSKALDIGLGIFGALGGVNGVIDMVDRLDD